MLFRRHYEPGTYGFPVKRLDSVGIWLISMSSGAVKQNMCKITGNCVSVAVASMDGSGSSVYSEGSMRPLWPHKKARMSYIVLSFCCLRHKIDERSENWKSAILIGAIAYAFTYIYSDLSKIGNGFGDELVWKMLGLCHRNGRRVSESVKENGAILLTLAYDVEFKMDNCVNFLFNAHDTNALLIIRT